MKLLPSTTALPAVPQAPAHNPAAGRYPTYRPCLRWDHGFTCPFCLLHEADLSEHGAEGESVIWIEHRQTRRQQPEQTDVYANCLLSCQFCNRRRGTKPITDENGRTLLDPRAVAWAERFERDGHRWKPKAGDADAEYTYEAYRPDDEKRIKRWHLRSDKIPDLLDSLTTFPRLIDRCRTRAQHAREDGDIRSARRHLGEARRWQNKLELARRDLRRFAAIPRDAPTRCRCGDTMSLALPDWLDRQTTEIDL